MKKQLEMVKEFHKACDIFTQENPNAHIPAHVKQVRKTVLEEEVKELEEAIDSENISASARELADVLYCLLGTVHALGISKEFEAVFEEVHNSNMSKLDKNIKPVLREDGKILKSDMFREPNVTQFFTDYDQR